MALPPYTGYKTNVNTTLGNEFATVGYRAHSMIHGEIEMETELDRYTQAQLDAMEAQGFELAIDGDEIEIAIPLNVAFFNPDLLELVQLGPLLRGLGLESQYKNDEQIDNQLRSVLFQVPVSGNPECLDGPTLPECFQRRGRPGRDRHRAWPRPRHAELQPAPAGVRVCRRRPRSRRSPVSPPTSSRPAPAINNPNSLDFLSLRDIDGNPIDLDDEAAAEGTATSGVRRSTVAARLRAIYGTVNNVDAFVGMVAEPHMPGQRVRRAAARDLWRQQFTALRDGDRFFYGNDQGLSYIRVDVRHRLPPYAGPGHRAATPTSRRRSIEPERVPGRRGRPAAGDAATSSTRWSPRGRATSRSNMAITNTGTTPINGWTMRYEFANGQRVTQLWNGRVSQSGARVSVANESWNGTLNPGQTLDGVGFNATFDNTTNAKPPNFSINNRRCTVT